MMTSEGSATTAGANVVDVERLGREAISLRRIIAEQVERSTYDHFARG